MIDDAGLSLAGHKPRISTALHSQANVEACDLNYLSFRHNMCYYYCYLTTIGNQTVEKR